MNIFCKYIENCHKSKDGLHMEHGKNSIINIGLQEGVIK